jgi:hypothetical protein
MARSPAVVVSELVQLRAKPYHPLACAKRTYAIVNSIYLFPLHCFSSIFCTLFPLLLLGNQGQLTAVV